MQSPSTTTNWSGSGKYTIITYHALDTWVEFYLIHCHKTQIQNLFGVHKTLFRAQSQYHLIKLATEQAAQANQQHHIKTSK
jgi:hypothetical protein